MKLLAFDTSSAACSIGLSIDGKITSYHDIAPMQQAKRILPLLNQLLQSEQIELSQLDAIAFGCGPGSFTGVRIAVSVAQGLAYATQKPLISISSLAVMAQAVYLNKGWTDVAVAIDARMNEVYWASYQVQNNNRVKLIGKEHISSPEKLVLSEASQYGVGNAWDIYQANIAVKPAFIEANQLPTAEAILFLAEAEFHQGRMISSLNAMPVYLRDDVAKKSNLV